MKSKLLVVLSVLLLFPAGVFGQVSAPDPLTTNPPTVNEPAPIPPEEVRDQDFLVHTSHGVDRGNLREKKILETLEGKSDEELTDALLVGDFASGQILRQDNIDAQVGLASISKLITACIVLDKISDGSLKEDTLITVPAAAAALGGTGYQLHAGDQGTVKQFLRASLISSGNDATSALAIHIAGSEEAFASMMNEKCRSLGLTSAHFINSYGLTDYVKDDYNKMSTRELFAFIRHLLQSHPGILTYTSAVEINEPERAYHKYNTNPILGIVPGIDGLKTGYTNAAGYCLAATGTKKSLMAPVIPGEEPLRLIGLFMGSRGPWARFVVSKRVMADALNRYTMIPLTRLDRSITTVQVPEAREEEVQLYPKQEFSLLWDSRTPIVSRIKTTPIAPPKKSGEEVGEVIFFRGEEEVFRTPLILKEDVVEKGWIYRIQRLIHQTFTALLA